MESKDNRRAARRANKERMKAKAKRTLPIWEGAVHNADHLAHCSCYMCGNPRRHFNEKSVQERRKDQENHDV